MHKLTKFKDQMQAKQIEWRRRKLDNHERGKHNGRFYDHVLPAREWELNLWHAISQGHGVDSQLDTSLPTYLKAEAVRKHSGSHNLLSSWVLCANLYFPFRGEAGRQLLAGFLQETVSPAIKSVGRVDLEYESRDKRLTPHALLGEPGTGRGAGQTSPDVAFEVEAASGPGLVLVECKFTEHSFYPCSGRTKPQSTSQVPNPNPSRCLNLVTVLDAPAEQCHLCTWGRLYWEYLGPVINHDLAGSLKVCPAAYGGYQLFRQQALVEGIARNSGLALVISAVAYDWRNSGLMTCMARSTGLADIRRDWATLFPGKAGFATFTHQAWVAWVAKHDQNGAWNDWLVYVKGRYGL